MVAVSVPAPKMKSGLPPSSFCLDRNRCQPRTSGPRSPSCNTFTAGALGIALSLDQLKDLRWAGHQRPRAALLQLGAAPVAPEHAHPEHLRAGGGLHVHPAVPDEQA